MAKEDLGDSTKYIKITNKNKNGKKIKPLIEIDQDKIDEDLKYAGYNLLVTSELDALFLSEKETENLFSNCMLLDT